MRKSGVRKLLWDGKGKTRGNRKGVKTPVVTPSKMLCFLSHFQHLTVSIVIIVLISERLFLKQKNMFQIEILYFRASRKNPSLSFKNLLNHFKSRDFLIEVSSFVTVN